MQITNLLWLALFCPSLLLHIAAYETISVTIDNSRDSELPPPGSVGPISGHFVSYSMEWQDALSLFTPNFFNVTLQMFRNLQYETGYGPWLRVGGGSTDYTWLVICSLQDYN